MSSSMFLAQLAESRCATSSTTAANARAHPRINNLSDLQRTPAATVRSRLARTWRRVHLTHSEYLDCPQPNEDSEDAGCR